MRLKCISSQALEFVRKSILPLPSESALIEKFGFLTCTPGLLRPAYEYLRDLVPRLTGPGETLASLMFDEMKLDERCEYYTKLDAVIGPHAYAQQTYVRSLTADWEFPLFLEFDKAMTQSTIMDIIQKLDDIGITILIE